MCWGCDIGYIGYTDTLITPIFSVFLFYNKYLERRCYTDISPISRFYTDPAKIVSSKIIVSFKTQISCTQEPSARCP